MNFECRWFKMQLRKIPGVISLYKKIHALGRFKITTIGTCFCNFTFKQLNTKIPITLINHLWARSDGVVDLLDGIRPDLKLIKYYFSHGHWDLEGWETRHQKDMFQTVLSWYQQEVDIRKDRPDILLFDSLYEQRHQFYQHRRDKWKAYFGKLYFDNSNVERAFENDFEFIGRIDPMEAARNISGICSYFRSRNPNVKIFYLHFPLLFDYAEPEIIERDAKIRDAISELQSEYFHIIAIPVPKVKPLTDPAHPNYAPQIWAHFYPEVYEYFADRIVNVMAGEKHLAPLFPDSGRVSLRLKK